MTEEQIVRQILDNIETKGTQDGFDRWLDDFVCETYIGQAEDEAIEEDADEDRSQELHEQAIEKGESFCRSSSRKQKIEYLVNHHFIEKYASMLIDDFNQYLND